MIPRATFQWGNFFAVWASLFLCSAAWSAPANKIPQYTSRLWQSEDGLPQNSVQAVLQTAEGYILAATQQGVAQFDGIRFTLFKDPSFPGFENLSVTVLHQGSNGDLWLGLEDSGLLQWRKGKWKWFRKQDGLPADVIRTVCEGRDGSIWIGTSGGLSRYKDGQFKNFTEEHGLSRNIVRALCEDDEGALWIGTDNGLNRFHDGAMATVPLENGLERNSIRVIFKDAEGAIWIGLHGGLTRMVPTSRAPQKFQVTHFSKEGSHSGNIISAICADSRGGFWIGTYNGLRRLVNGEFIEELNGEGASFDLVYSIREDREGNLWVGTKGGLHCLTPRRFEALTTLQGLSHNNVTSICEGRDGSIWVGTWGGGLNQFKFEHERLNLVSVYSSSNGLGSDFVLGLGPDRKGGVWIGTPFDTHNLKYLRNGKVLRYGTGEGFLDSSITVIQEDSSGNVWIGTSGALNRFSDGRFHRYTTQDGLLHNRVRSIFEAGNGELLLGTESGLTHYKNQKFTSGGTSHPVLSIYEDREQTTWIATLGGGLTRARPPHPLRGYTAKEGLLDDNIYEILDDDSGFMWMSCAKGVFRARKKEFDDLDQRKAGTISSRSYGKADGLPGIECSSIAKPSVCKSRNGRLLFATTKGVAIVDPRAIHSNELPPPVIIEEVIADKKTVTSLNGHLALSEIGKRNSTLAIPPGRGELEIHYTALSFQAPEKNRFKYKLEGVDSDWVNAGVRRVAYYNNLSPGRYRFRITGCNNDGVWNNSGASLSITIAPHFWQTWWFLGMVGMAVVSAIGGTSRYITKKKLERRLQSLEQQHAIEKERTRIAQDMHDDLGLRLTEILMASDIAGSSKTVPKEVKEQMERISHRAREIIDTMDAIVWAVNPRNDSLDVLAGYICEYVETFSKNSAIRCRLDVPDQLPSLPLSSELRHHIFMVVKEALNNLAKYSQASEFWLRLTFEKSILTISVEDNGKGFSATEVSGFGNGLSNMRKRMESIRGTCTIASVPGEGTCVSLRVFVRGDGEQKKG